MNTADFWRRVRDLNPGDIIHALRDFESRLFDHLSNSPCSFTKQVYYTSIPRKNQGFSGFFFANSITSRSFVVMSR